MRERVSLRLGLSAALLLASADAFAGAWTEPAGRGQMIATVFGWSGSAAPWGASKPAARASRIEAQAFVEYGASDRLTLFGQSGLESYRLRPPSADSFAGLDYTTFGARLGLVQGGPLALSVEASGAIPGAQSAARPAQAGNTGFGAEARASLGYAFGRSAFVDAEAAYRLRTAGPPSEWHGDLTLGLRPAPRVLLLLQSFNILSNGAGSAGFPAWASSLAAASCVYSLDEDWSAQFGAFSNIVVRRTSSQRGLSLALWRKF